MKPVLSARAALAAACIASGVLTAACAASAPRQASAPAQRRAEIELPTPLQADPIASCNVDFDALGARASLRETQTLTPQSGG